MTQQPCAHVQHATDNSSMGMQYLKGHLCAGCEHVHALQKQLMPATALAPEHRRQSFKRVEHAGSYDHLYKGTWASSD